MRSCGSQAVNNHRNKLEAAVESEQKTENKTKCRTKCRIECGIKFGTSYRNNHKQWFEDEKSVLAINREPQIEVEHSIDAVNWTVH